MEGSLMQVNSISFSGVMPIMAAKNEGQVFKGSEMSKADTFAKVRVLPPEISRIRLFFGFLSDEQVAQINASGRLPDNAKFKKGADGNFTIHNNFFNVTEGTQKLPAGYEVRRNWLGFAVVVPEDTKSLFIRNK